MELGAGNAYGFNPQIKVHGAFRGSLVEENYKDYASAGGLWLSHKTFISYLLVKNHFAPFEFFGPSKSSFLNGLSIHIAAGGYYHKTRLNLYDQNGSIYNFSSNNLPIGRIRATLDNDYETIFSQDNENIKSAVGTGISMRLFKSWNLETLFSYSFLIPFTDYLDGLMYRTSFDKSNNLDINHLYGINLLYKF